MILSFSFCLITLWFTSEVIWIKHEQNVHKYTQIKGEGKSFGLRWAPPKMCTLFSVTTYNWLDHSNHNKT